MRRTLRLGAEMRRLSPRLSSHIVYLSRSCCGYQGRDYRHLFMRYIIAATERSKIKERRVYYVVDTHTRCRVIRGAARNSST